MEYPVPHLSNSSIKTYLSCPHTFRVKHILKIKPPSNEHFALGKAIHSSAELQAKFRMRTGKNLPLQAILENYQKECKLESQLLNKWGIKALREMYVQGHDLTEQLYYYLVKRPPVAVEQYFKVDLGYDIPILGYIDVIFEDEALRDFKTASKPWSRSDLDNATQFTIYYEAYKKMYGGYPKSIGTIELDKTRIKTHQDQSAIREQLTYRDRSSMAKLDILVEKVCRGMKENKYPRCGKRSCFGCSTM